MATTSEADPIHEIPGTAYALHRWQLDAWESYIHHPSWITFEIFRGNCGNYDGYIKPIGERDGMTCAYVHGWLNGRDSKA